MRTVPVWKPILVAVLLLGAAYYLYPSVVWYGQLAALQDPLRPDVPHSPQLNQLNEELEALLVRDATDNQHLMRIDDLNARIRVEEQRFYGFKDRRIPLGLDLNGGIQLRLKVLVDPASSAQQQFDDVEQVLKVYKGRIDRLGLTEPLIEKQPDNTILIQIPGVTNPEQVINIIKTTAQLQFQLSPSFDEGQRVINDIDDLLKRDVSSRLSPLGNERLCAWRVASADVRYVSDTVFAQEAQAQAWRPEYGFYWGEELRDREGQRYRNLYMLEKRAEVTGDLIEEAKVAFQQSMITEPQVRLRFKDLGKRRFSVLTRNNVNRHLAVVLDDIVYSAPVIREPITQGVASIEGQFSVEDARNLALVLEAGALQRPVEIIQNITVGAQMGVEAIEKGRQAIIIGVIAVFVFMIVYYGLAGVVADFALILNIFFLAAGLALFKGTLTMPGIAGIVLLLGMAVDANVLVFERMREEMTGDRLVSAVIERGYNRAWSAIIDGNLTTLFTAIVLFQFGTGPVKGFAVTLSLGLIVSLFTALFVTRMIFEYQYGKAKNATRMSLGKFTILTGTKIDFMSRSRLFAIISTSFVVISMLLAAITWNQHLGIEFAGGHLVQISFEDHINAAELRDMVKGYWAGDAQEPHVEPVIQTVGQTGKDFIIRLHERVRVPLEIETQNPDLELTSFIRNELERTSPTPLVPGMFSVEKVTGTVGEELRGQAFMAILFSLIAILAYITIRFEFIYALGAIAALLHDVLFCLGTLCLWNLVFPGSPREISLPVVAALLTVFGYSVNDTIVVFDRIRENRSKAKALLHDIINESINQCLSRTLITSITTLLAILSVLFFGGSTLNDFAFVITLGVLVGTYSSIFIASWLVFEFARQQQYKGR